jgi:hypothetical protein
MKSTGKIQQDVQWRCIVLKRNDQDTLEENYSSCLASSQSQSPPHALQIPMICQPLSYS